MISQFESVLKKMILPQYPEIHDVWVSQFGLRGDFIRVRYVLNQNWKSNIRPVELQDETVSLYKMMSPDKNGDIFIEMSHKDESEKKTFIKWQPWKD